MHCFWSDNNDDAQIHIFLIRTEMLFRKKYRGRQKSNMIYLHLFLAQVHRFIQHSITYNFYFCLPQSFLQNGIFVLIRKIFMNVSVLFYASTHFRICFQTEVLLQTFKHLREFCLTLKPRYDIPQVNDLPATFDIKSKCVRVVNRNVIMSTSSIFVRRMTNQI